MLEIISVLTTGAVFGAILMALVIIGGNGR